MKMWWKSTSIGYKQLQHELANVRKPCAIQIKIQFVFSRLACRRMCVCVRPHASTCFLHFNDIKWSVMWLCTTAYFCPMQYENKLAVFSYILWSKYTYYQWDCALWRASLRMGNMILIFNFELAKRIIRLTFRLICIWVFRKVIQLCR